MEPRLERDRPAATTKARRRSERSRGQVLVIFAAAIVFFIGLMAIVVDVTWYWANSLKVQRAADAAALAGAVWLPDQPAKAVSVAYAAATQDGYTTGSGVTVTAKQDPARDVQLDTSVSAPVPTFFMRLFGINSIQATRIASAEYVLPVPMGSPLNYFGAFGTLRGGWIQTDTGWQYPTKTLSEAGFGGIADKWLDPAYAYVDEGPPTPLNTTTANVIDAQGFTTFRSEGFPTIANFGMTATNVRFQSGGGIEVVVQASSSDGSGCPLQAEVSSNADQGAAATWWGITAPNLANGEPATLTTTPTEYSFGGDTSSGAGDATNWWRASGWTKNDFTDAKFAVRLKAVGSGSCATATTFVDYIKVRVNYEEQEPPIKGPNNESLSKQGVWAGILSQGAEVINGDAYAARYNSNPTLNTQYAPTSFYDYAVEMQPGTSGGSVYVFDPVFCDTNNDFSQGMGDTWYSGTGAMSTFYDLYDTNNTPYDLGDDTWIAGNTGPTGASNPLYGLFRKSRASDPSQQPPGYTLPSGVASCQRGTTSDKTKGAYWHNRWWRLAAGIAGPVDTTPRIYRIRVTSTDPAATSDQNSTVALNNFSLFASVKGHACPTTPADPKCPRVYGLGTMEAFAPLDPNKDADLYLSQIGLAYAGKTIKVSLWDPGDTNQLPATLSFLMPNGSGYTSASFTWTATRFASGGSNCNGSGGPTTSLQTNTGGTSKFNGCWVIFSIPIPTGYTAPTPPGEPGPGWWKIRYRMGSSSNPNDTASDLTTWKTQIVGNPVHLVVP